MAHFDRLVAAGCEERRHVPVVCGPQAVIHPGEGDAGLGVAVRAFGRAAGVEDVLERRRGECRQYAGSAAGDVVLGAVDDCLPAAVQQDRQARGRDGGDGDARQGEAAGQ
jgi:hypothetical protein